MSSTKIQVQGQPLPRVSSRNHRMRNSVVCGVSIKRHHRVSNVFSQRVKSGPSLGSVPKKTDEIPFLRGDGNGRFGRFGGKFVPETLISPLRDLEDEFNIVLNDHEFQNTTITTRSTTFRSATVAVNGDGLGALSTLSYGEYANNGPGADTSKRVTWKGFKVIRDSKEAEQFTVAKLIQGGLWLKPTGVTYQEWL